MAALPSKVQEQLDLLTTLYSQPVNPYVELFLSTYALDSEPKVYNGCEFHLGVWSDNCCIPYEAIEKHERMLRGTRLCYVGSGWNGGDVHI